MYHIISYLLHMKCPFVGGNEGRTRLDRIQAIQQTAMSLQTRLHHEAQKISNMHPLTGELFDMYGFLCMLS